MRQDDVEGFDVVAHRCRLCNQQRAVPMELGEGGWYYTDESEEDSYCCDRQMEIIDEYIG